MKQLFPEDKTKPHFSLKEVRPIPPYKGPKRAFVELLNEVDLKVRHYRRECWNIAIELIADYLELMTNPWKYSLPDRKWAGLISKPSYSGFQELKEHIQKTGLVETYVKAAKEEPADYIGDIFIEEMLAAKADRLGQVLTPMQIVNFMVKSVGIGEKKQRSRPDPTTEAWLSIEAMAFEGYLEKISRNLLMEHERLRSVAKREPVSEKYVIKPQTVLDPCTGTGRFLLGANWQSKGPVILFGIEIDISLYRACLVNMALFSKYPYSIVCGDTLMIEGHHGDPGSKLWDFGNQWDPPDISAFYFKPIPPFKFSLAELAKARIEHPEPQQAQVIPETPPAFSLAELVTAKKQT